MSPVIRVSDETPLGWARLVRGVGLNIGRGAYVRGSDGVKDSVGAVVHEKR